MEGACVFPPPPPPNRINLRLLVKHLLEFGPIQYNFLPFVLTNNMTRPPAALDSQARKKSRASSFGEFVSRLRPSNRAERGGTLRNEVCKSGNIGPETNI